jgi:hypothetical protein
MKVPTIGLILVVLASPLAAQIRYKDDEGVMNWVDSMDQVPLQYRSGAVDTSPKVAPPSEKDRKAPASDEAKQEKAGEEAKPQRYAVTYAVEGEIPFASVTFRNDKGATQQEKVKIPWKQAFVMEKGAPLSISAQNQYPRGGVTVRIIVEGKVLTRSDSDGPFSTASANITCC